MQKLQHTSITALLTLSFLSYSTTALSSSFNLEDEPTVLDEPRPRAQAAFNLDDDEEIVVTKKRADRPKTKKTVAFSMDEPGQETAAKPALKKRAAPKPAAAFSLDEPEKAEAAKPAAQKSAVRPKAKVTFSMDEPEEVAQPATKKRADRPKEVAADNTTPIKKRGKVMSQPMEEEDAFDEEDGEGLFNLEEELAEEKEARDLSTVKKRNSRPRKAKAWYSEGKYADLAKIPMAEGDDGLMDYMDNVEELLAEQGGLEMDDDARELLMKVFREDLKDGRKHQKAKVAQWLKEIEQEDGVDFKLKDLSEDEFLEALREQEAKMNNEHLGEWKDKVARLKNHPEAYKEALELAEDLAVEDVSNEGVAVKKKRLRFLCDLPWDEKDDVDIDLAKAQATLDADHHGLEKIKERILEYLAVLKRNPHHKGSILCFVGPPGVGKTTLSASIAKALGRKFVSAALGGVHDEAAIRGSLPVYIGSTAGKPLRALKKAGVTNPVILLDEIDKIGQDSTQGSPADALLELLDPAQNKAFVDHFIDVPYDFSNVLFLCSANSMDKIPPALIDRLEVIELSSYTDQEKVAIAKKHLIPKAIEKHGLKPNELVIRTAALQNIVHEYTREAGVRNLEREISKLCRKVVKKNGQGRAQQVVLEPGMLEEYLGPRKEIRDKPLERDTVGHVMGLAYNPMGGSMLPIEVALTEGKGMIAKTGNLGKVIMESVDYAWTLVKNMLPEYGMSEKDVKDKNVHVHLYDAAVEKEGPSAGAAITTCIMSAVTKIPINRSVCMTGEVNLLGNVLPIGGVKEKLIAAHRAGMKIALVPKANVPDLADVPAIVKQELKIIPVGHISEVLRIALVRNQVAAEEPNASLSIGF